MGIAQRYTKEHVAKLGEELHKVPQQEALVGARVFRDFSAVPGETTHPSAAGMPEELMKDALEERRRLEAQQ